MAKGVKRKKEQANFAQWIIIVILALVILVLSYNIFFTGYAVGDEEIETGTGEGVTQGTTEVTGGEATTTFTSEVKSLTLLQTDLINGLSITYTEVNDTNILLNVAPETVFLGKSQNSELTLTDLGENSVAVIKVVLLDYTTDYSSITINVSIEQTTVVPNEEEPEAEDATLTVGEWAERTWEIREVEFNQTLNDKDINHPYTGGEFDEEGGYAFDYAQLYYEFSIPTSQVPEARLDAFKFGIVYSENIDGQQIEYQDYRIYESDVATLPANSMVCTDSDVGMNIYVKGQTSGYDLLAPMGYRITNVPDQCANDGVSISEMGCTPEGYFTSATLVCPNGCVEGACTLVTPEAYCSGTLPCNTITSQSDCELAASELQRVLDATGWTTEADFCSWNAGTSTCDGVTSCLVIDDETSCTAQATCTWETGETPCADTDGGLNYGVAGVYSGTIGEVEYASVSEACSEDGSSVVEGYCDNGVLKLETHTCGYKCENGACIEAPIEQVCQNTDTSCGTYPSCNDCTATKQNFCGEDGNVYSKNQICIDSQCRWWDEFISSLNAGNGNDDNGDGGSGSGSTDPDMDNYYVKGYIDGTVSASDLEYARANGQVTSEQFAKAILGKTDFPESAGDPDMDNYYVKGYIDGTVSASDLEYARANGQVTSEQFAKAILGKTDFPESEGGDADSDGDGVSNADEQAAGTNPNSASSVPIDDGDGLCENGESCCDANPEGCNLNNGVDGEGNSNIPQGGGPGELELTTEAILTGHVTADEISRTSDPSIKLADNCGGRAPVNPSCNWLGNEKVGTTFSCNPNDATCQPIGGSVTLEKCGQVCRSGQCTCAPNGEFVWTWGGGNCCSGKTDWLGVCRDCQSGGTFVWWVSGNCCSGEIWPGGWCK